MMDDETAFLTSVKSFNVARSPQLILRVHFFILVIFGFTFLRYLFALILIITGMYLIVKLKYMRTRLVDWLIFHKPI